MRLNSKWNRRSFLGSVGLIAGSILTPRKLFSRNRGAQSPARVSADSDKPAIPTKNLACPRSSTAKAP